MSRISCRRFDRALSGRAEKEISKALDRYRVKALDQAELAEVLAALQLCEVSKGAERNLAQEFWDLLGGDKRGEVPKQAIAVLLLTITRPQRSNSVDGSLSQLYPQPGTEGTTIGTYITTEKGETVYSLSDIEKQYLYRKYAVRLRCNRLSRSPSREHPKKEDREEHSPRISARSGLLAEASRARVVEAANSARKERMEAKEEESKQPPPKRSLKDISISELLEMHRELYEK